MELLAALAIISLLAASAISHARSDRASRREAASRGTESEQRETLARIAMRIDALEADIRRCLAWIDAQETASSARRRSTGHSSAGKASPFEHPSVIWALETLGIGRAEAETSARRKKAFRRAMMTAHPDQGGSPDALAEVMAARKILDEAFGD